MKPLKDEEYEKKIKYLKESYKNKEIRDFLEKNYHETYVFSNESFYQFLIWMEKEKPYLETNYELCKFSARCKITRLYNNLLIHLGILQRKEETWDKPYISRKVEKPIDKDKDFYSIDISYLFKSDISKDEMKIIVTSGDFKKDAIEAAFEKLQKSKKYQDINKSFLEVKKAVCRFQYKELLVTVGLRNDILKLKEEMQEDLIEEYLDNKMDVNREQEPHNTRLRGSQ